MVVLDLAVVLFARLNQTYYGPNINFHCKDLRKRQYWAQRNVYIDGPIIIGIGLSGSLC